MRSRSPDVPDTVAIFTHSSAGGAFANISRSLARGFIEARVPQVYVVRLSGQPQLTAAELFEGTLIEELPVARSVFSPLPLSRFLRRAKPQLTISMPSLVNAAAIGGWLLSGRVGALVPWEQATASFKARVEHRRDLRFRMMPFLARTLYPKATGIAAVSAGVLDDLNDVTGRRVERDRRDVIHNPLDIDRCRALARERVEHPWFQEDVPVLLSVARLEVQKDLPTLLRAIDLVRRRRPVHMLILGDGPERSRIDRLVHELGIEDHVRLAGLELNPYRYMSRSTSLVLSSRDEGLPLVVLEALACGLPVIATACPGSKEILDSVGTGTVVPVGDVQALAAAILLVLASADARRREAEAADLYEFTPRAVAEKWLDFHERIRKPGDNA